MISKIPKESVDIVQETAKLLKQIIPECFTEGKIDLDKLEKTLGKSLDKNDEKYTFNWAGRNDTFKNIQVTSKGTLSPDKQESVNFEKTENIFIEGENLEVLKLLQKSYFEKIKMIYIDPPYNTGNDFIYKDDFHNSIQSYLEQTGQIESGVKLTSNPETSGRFHSDWISFMYSRLFLARNLLKEDGVIFVSIGDEEVHNLRLILNEIFGEENFEGHVHWRRRHNQPNDPTKMLAIVGEHVLVYAKNSEYLKQVGVGKVGITGKFSNPDDDPRGDWATKPWKVGTGQTGTRYQIKTPTGKIYDEEWMGDENTFQDLLRDKRIIFTNQGNGLPRKKYFKSEREAEGQSASNWWGHEEYGHNQGASDEIYKLFGQKNVFDNPKPTKLIKNMVDIANCKNDDIVLDFFAGSCTLADAILQKNVEDETKIKFICVQIPELIDENDKKQEDSVNFLKKINRPLNISEIGKERIRKVIDKIKEDTKQTKLLKSTSHDLGFKMLRLAKSNFNIWENYSEKDIKKLKEQMKLFQSPLIAGAKELDVIYECMIKEGFDLNSEIEKLNISSNIIYKVSDVDSFFYITLDKVIKDESLHKMNLNKDDIFICIDAALNDSKKTNLSKQCVLKTL